MAGPSFGRTDLGRDDPSDRPPALLVSDERRTTYWSRPNPDSPVGEERFYALHPNLPRYHGPDGKGEYVIPYLGGKCEKWMLAFQVADLSWDEHLTYSIDSSYQVAGHGKVKPLTRNKMTKDLEGSNDYPHLPQRSEVYDSRVMMSKPAPLMSKDAALLVAIIHAWGWDGYSAVVVDIGRYVDLRYLYDAMGVPAAVVCPRKPGGLIPRHVYHTQEWPKLPKGRVLVVTDGKRKYPKVAGTVMLMMRRVETFAEGTLSMTPDFSSPTGYFSVTDPSHPERNKPIGREDEIRAISNHRKEASAISLAKNSREILLPYMIYSTMLITQKIDGPYGEFLTWAERAGLFDSTELNPGRPTRKDLGFDVAFRKYHRVENKKFQVWRDAK